MPPRAPGWLTILLIGAFLAAGVALTAAAGEWAGLAAWLAVMGVVAAASFLVSLRGALVVCEGGVMVGTLLPVYQELGAARWEQVDVPSLRFYRRGPNPPAVQALHYRVFNRMRVESSRVRVSLSFLGPIPPEVPVRLHQAVHRRVFGMEPPQVAGAPGTLWVFSCGERARPALAQQLTDAIARATAYGPARIEAQLAEVVPIPGERPAYYAARIPGDR